MRYFLGHTYVADGESFDRSMERRTGSGVSMVEFDKLVVDQCELLCSLRPLVTDFAVHAAREGAERPVPEEEPVTRVTQREERHVVTSEVHGAHPRLDECRLTEVDPVRGGGTGVQGASAKSESPSCPVATGSAARALTSSVESIPKASAPPASRKLEIVGRNSPPALDRAGPPRSIGGSSLGGSQGC